MDNKLNIEEVKKLSNDEINILLKNDDGFVINLEHLEEDFIKNFNSDLNFLINLRDKWKDIKNNPKLEEFAKKIKEDLENEPKRKIVVFSQFADTVYEIYGFLKEKGIKVMKV
jgi:ERCC4-related helicase